MVNLRLIHPDKVPIIVKMPSCKKKMKFLAQQDITFLQFMTIIRKRIDINNEEGLYLYANNSTSINMTSTLISVYNEYEKNGVLNMTLLKENVFVFIKGSEFY